MNVVILVGEVASAVDVKDLKNSKLAKFSVKTVERLPDGREFSDFNRIAAWGGQADAAEGLQEGDLVTVVGKMQTRSYDKGGEKRYVTEVNARSVENLAVNVPGAVAAGATAGDNAAAGPDPDIPF